MWIRYEQPLLPTNPRRISADLALYQTPPARERRETAAASGRLAAVLCPCLQALSAFWGRFGACGGRLPLPLLGWG